MVTVTNLPIFENLRYLTYIFAFGNSDKKKKRQSIFGVEPKETKEKEKAWRHRQLKNNNPIFFLDGSSNIIKDRSSTSMDIIILTRLICLSNDYFSIE